MMIQLATPGVKLSLGGEAFRIFISIAVACMASAPGNELRAYRLQPKKTRLPPGFKSARRSNWIWPFLQRDSQPVRLGVSGNGVYPSNFEHYDHPLKSGAIATFIESQIMFMTPWQSKQVQYTIYYYVWINGSLCCIYFHIFSYIFIYFHQSLNSIPILLVSLLDEATGRILWTAALPALGDARGPDPGYSDRLWACPCRAGGSAGEVLPQRHQVAIKCGNMWTHLGNMETWSFKDGQTKFVLPLPFILDRGRLGIPLESSGFIINFQVKAATLGCLPFSDTLI